MAWCTTEDGKYRIESISRVTFPGALQVLREGFFPNEAVCIKFEVDKDPLAAEEMLELCADAALDGLSLVAVATDTEEVVATVFCKLEENPMTESTEKSSFEIYIEERCKRPSTKAMMEFLAELDEKCNYFVRYGVDCLCEIMFLGTKPEHRQKGLAKLLTKTAVDVIKESKKGPIAPLTIEDLGPDYSFMKPRKPVTKPPQLCTAVWSAVGSKRCGEILGFKVIEVFSFDDMIEPCSDRIGAVTTCEGAALRI
ncbi:hypothetical protein PYW07_013749 [Mythimna separata]|uniref:N-acetyltransferase domain-containing protein n=1 Tax=Mythimna separata TaxID=271217 RepID=A0AAD7YFQ8_MYTSE|nr:hypothetical protein PYW07_013749 [Mythimna separata]